MTTPPRVSPAPFDAVLLVSFGGPTRPSDIRPFLRNVLRGRRVPPDRFEAVVSHYERFGGFSPITECTWQQARGLAARLEARGMTLPVHVGMRNWHPFLSDTLRELTSLGVRRLIGFPAAAHRCYSGCTQYKQNVLQAREELAAAGLEPPEVVYVGDWFAHPGFVSANAARVRAARDQLPAALREAARLVCTAHSIPESVAARYPYVAQLETTAELVARAARMPDWTLVFQSRSGRPEDPWLGPDVNEYVRKARPEGLKAAVLAPIGFVCDHVEVLYDLDVEAAATCQDVGLPMVRASSVNAHPAFLDAMADLVQQTFERYKRGRPLNIVNADRPNATELPPPARGAE